MEELVRLIKPIIFWCSAPLRDPTNNHYQKMTRKKLENLKIYTFLKKRKEKGAGQEKTVKKKERKKKIVTKLPEIR